MVRKKRTSDEHKSSIVIPFLRGAKSVEDKIAFLKSVQGNSSLSEYDRSLAKESLNKYTHRELERKGEYFNLVESLYDRGRPRDLDLAFSLLPKLADDSEEALTLKWRVSNITKHYDNATKYLHSLASLILKDGRESLEKISPEHKNELNEELRGNSMWAFVKSSIMNPAIQEQFTPAEAELCRKGFNEAYRRGCGGIHTWLRDYGGRMYLDSHGEYGRYNGLRHYFRKRDITEGLAQGKYQPTQSLQDYLTNDKAIQNETYQPQDVNFQPNNSFDNIKSQRGKKARRLGATIAIAGLGASIFFAGSNFTGNVISSLSTTSINYLGIGTFLMGIAGAILFFKKK